MHFRSVADYCKSSVMVRIRHCIKLHMAALDQHGGMEFAVTWYVKAA